MTHTPNESEEPDEGDNEPLGQTGIVPRDLLFSLPLDQVIDELRVLTWLENEETKTIGIRVAPVGFRVILDLLADEARTSYSRIALAASLQGLVLLKAEPAVRACWVAYHRAADAAMDEDDKDAMARLSKTGSYDFEHGEAVHTTFPIWRKVHAQAVRLALACGLAPGRLAVLCIVRAILTRENQRKYRDRLQDEIDAFLRHVSHRERVLRLGF